MWKGFTLELERYLHFKRFFISQGQRSLGKERDEAICQTPEPLSKRAFNGKEKVLIWSPQCRKDFQELKHAFMTGPALGLLDFKKCFELFVHERFHLTY